MFGSSDCKIIAITETIHVKQSVRVVQHTSGTHRLVCESTFSCHSMESRDLAVDADVGNLFGRLLIPPPNANDACEGTSSASRHPQQRAFVVNRAAGRDLCYILQPDKFMSFSAAMQSRILCLMDEGLSAGLCSVIRLRLSCESNQVVWCLLDLLKALTCRIDAKNSRRTETSGLVEVLSGVLGMVCSAGLEVDELKGLLRELRLPSAMTQPLVAALTVMMQRDTASNMKTFAATSALKCPAVQSIFNFDGDGAGLVLPTIARWPFALEYQIVFWVRVEQPARSLPLGVQGTKRRAHLITLTTQMGAGVDYYLEDSRLFVVVADGKRSGHVQAMVTDMGEVGFVGGRWHALVIRHKRSSALMFNKDHLEVYLDEEVVFSANVPYPRHVTESLTRCSIGWDLDGQTSGVLLLTSAAHPKVVRSMLNRLAGHVDNLSEEDLECRASAPDLDLWTDTASVSSQERFRRMLLGSEYRIFAALLPDRTVHGRCLEPHHGFHARLRGDSTHVWTTHPAQNVIGSIGGTTTLLALAYQLLSEAPSPLLGRTTNTSSTAFIGSNVDTVLSVLLSFLDGNVQNQDEFLRAGGVEILELLLGSSCRTNFASAGAHTVMVLERILQACRLHHVSAAASHRSLDFTKDVTQPRSRTSSLEHQVLMHLFTNISLWAKAPPDFQFGLVTSVLGMVRDAPERCRQFIPMGTVLASICICCPDQVSDASDAPKDAGTGMSRDAHSEIKEKTSSVEHDWTSMSWKERLHLRDFLWRVVRLLLEKEVRPQDGVALIHFMASCEDTRLVCELVQTLNALMRQPVPPAGLFRALESASLVGEEVWPGRRGSKTEFSRTSLQTGYLALVLQRCILVEGASESLRVAGLRAANVFMARSAKEYERSAPSAPGGASMDWRGPQDAESGVGSTSFVKPRDNLRLKVSTVFPLLSEGLMRDRHALGEGTYAALLEMVLLADERELPWSEQVQTIGVIHPADGAGRSGSNHEEGGDGKRRRGKCVEGEESADGVWSDYDPLDIVSSGGNDDVLDDAQRIRNVLPLVLIFQCLPAMTNSVQVRSHGDLMLMLKFNVGNRQKVVELSHANGDKFWGVWGRCLFLMMAPLFSRADTAQVEGDEQGGEARDSARKGNYLMVLKLYVILLEHTMTFDDKGYKEIALASSFQRLIPHGRSAVRVLLAQLAYEVGKTSPMANVPLEEEQSFLTGQSRPSDFSSAGADKGSEHVEIRKQPRWNNMVHLAFIAANVVSDDVSTITAGLFPKGDNVVRGGELPGGETGFGGDGEAICASAASSCTPFLLCSNPAKHVSVALSARVLDMFKVISGGPSPALVELCTARGIAPCQGPLLFPLLRLGLFLLVRLHPLSQPALENLRKLTSLVQYLLSENWRLQAGSDDSASSDDMCLVILGHVHAALIRLKAKAMTVLGTSNAVASAAKVVPPGDGVADAPMPLGSFMDATSAYEIGRALRGLLQHLVVRRLDLLSARLGEQLMRNLQDATTFEPQDLSASGESGRDLERDTLEAREGWDRLVQSLRWMERSSLFTPALDTTMHPVHGVHALLEACLPSLKAAEELESHAVRDAGERVQQWQEVVNRASLVAPMGEDKLGLPTVSPVQVEALRQEALKAEALRGMKTGRRLLPSHRRLQLYVKTLSAAWSPWAAGDDLKLRNEPAGWEVSSHKDQRMRQMLLVPVDADTGHQDASYANTPPRSGDSANLVAPDDDVHNNAVLLPALKPSASLLAGEVGFSDDDEEEVEGEEFGDVGPPSPTRPRGPEAATSEWEDITRQSASQAEIEAAVQLATSQHAWDDLHSVPTPTKGCDGRAFQNLQGEWAATNVFRHGSVPGKLYLFEKSLVFQSGASASDGNVKATPAWLMQHAGQKWRWRLERLTQVHLRRFLLSPKAVELFWADSPEVFIAFENVHDRQAFTRNLRKRDPRMLPATTQRGILHPRKVLKASKLTELWRRRQISNFQYIMELNVIAGRSYNDITQYPVFPWVLADYTSDELDLNNPASFRDLSKPMGAVNERRRKQFEDRYASFDDETVPKFMYGTHYSSAGVVLHYHVRQDPFTTLHINLQDGRFDCPDRLFNDLGKCWAGCIDENNMSDVKELTPEFFYCPEIFLNSNKLPLGEMQDGMGVVDDVRLPPWAKDAFDFVRIHRLALESEQVSQHLHHWIDLVFGYKQRGNEAVKAANVFYYLTYEGAVDLSLVDDAHQRDAMEAQIRHFGQTPSQIMMEPHPVRLPPEECVLPLFSATSALSSLRVFSPRHKPRSTHGAAVLLVYCTEDRLVCVDASLRVTTWTWSGLPNGRGLPFTLGLSRTNSIPSRLLHMTNVSTKTFLANGRLPGASSKRDTTKAEPARMMGSVHSCFGLHSGSEANAESIISCGYWDHVVRLHQVDSTLKLPLGGSGTGGHRGAITCLAIAEGSSLLVTGGEDATCRVWVVSNAPMASALGGGGAGGANTTNRASSGDAMVCVHVLYGHEAPVTCLAVSEELDAVVSGAGDGRIVLHRLKDGGYVRQYRCGPVAAKYKGAPVPEASQLVFSCHGEVVAHSWTDLSLHRFSLNGVRLATASAPTLMSCLLTAGGGEYLLTGGNDGLIRVYTLHDLCVLHTLDLQNHGGVTCMRLSPNDEYLFAGSEDGEVSIITDARKRLRMLDLALRRAFVG